MDRYSKEHLKDLMDIRQDALNFTMKLRFINAISAQEEEMMAKFLAIIDAEIFGVAFIIELEETLREKP